MPANTTEVQIETTRLPCVVGRKIWEDNGEPVQGTLHTAFRSRVNMHDVVTTDWLNEQGRFWIGVPIEPHALLEPFESRGNASTARWLRLLPNVFDSTALRFEHKIDLTDVTFPLDVGTVRVPRAPVMHLRLVGTEGTPIQGAAVASDLESASSDAEGRVRIAVGEGPLHVLAFDQALSEFALPDEPTSVEAPLELQLAPGATLEVVAQRGVLESPWAGHSVRLSWTESPFAGVRTEGPGLTASMLYGLFRQLLGWAFLYMDFHHTAGRPGDARFVLPARGPRLVPGWRSGATARLELLDVVDQPLGAVELRAPDAPRRFTLDVTGLVPDTGRLRLRVVDAEGRSLPSASFQVGAQASTRTKFMQIDGSSLDLGPLALGLYDVTVRVPGYLFQQLDGLEATLDAAERTVVVVPSRWLNVALVDEAGQVLCPSTIELRDEAGRWSPSQNGEEVSRWTMFHDLPRAPLELTAVVGTRTWTRAVDSEQTSLSLDLPMHGRLALGVHARELLTGDDGRLAVRLRELDGEGSLAEEVSVYRHGVGPSTATFDLLPGRYELAVDFEEYENLEVALETDEPLRQTLLRREVEVRARERTDVEAGQK